MLNIEEFYNYIKEIYKEHRRELKMIGASFEGHVFEIFLITFLEGYLGTAFEQTGFSWDGGLDLKNERYLIQSKFNEPNSFPINSSLLKDFANRGDRYIKRYFITTGQVKNNLKTLARSLGIELIDGENLYNLLKENNYYVYGRLDKIKILSEVTYSINKLKDRASKHINNDKLEYIRYNIKNHPNALWGEEFDNYGESTLSHNDVYNMKDIPIPKKLKDILTDRFFNKGNDYEVNVKYNLKEYNLTYSWRRNCLYNVNVLLKDISELTNNYIDTDKYKYILTWGKGDIEKDFNVKLNVKVKDNL